jgi:N-acetyl-gamma-glutamylphosphate reductase
MRLHSSAHRTLTSGISDCAVLRRSGAIDNLVKGAAGQALLPDSLFIHF